MSKINFNYDTPQLTEEEFSKLIKLIYEETRIKMNDNKKALVTSRISKRLRSLNLATFKDYIKLLESGEANEELVNFTNAVTTNKTDFFRENKHFEYMKSTFLPNWEKDYKSGKVKNLRIWSAACSTGEEPYSILITLYEYFGKNIDNYDIRVFSSDIDTNVLNHAQNGVYREDTVSPIPIDLLRKYFLKGSGVNEGKYKVKDFLKSKIVFRALNFKDKDFDIHTEFDLIFCRNVIIYFDKEFQKELFSRLYTYLKDDALVFIGHSETLFGVSDKYKYITSNIYKKF